MLRPDGLKKRDAVLRALRQFFHSQGYLEVETPIRLPAPAPEAHIEPVRTDGWFLQTSPELCMKRLLAAGCDKIFQICRCWRRGERGSRHLPEFTMLEWYRTHSDYRDLMADCEELFLHLAAALGGERAVGGPPALTVDGRVISLTRPWERITVAEAFHRWGQVSLRTALADNLFEEVLCRDIEPHLGQAGPALLYDYPAALGALARLKADDPQVAERFELYINGIEIANGFSELTEPVAQRRRFVAEMETVRSLGRQPGPMPEPFLADLARLPPAAGIALGVDRLVMLLLDVRTIDEAVSFTPEEL
ncbi:MAG: EF-P lysine aminoacylase GenX [Deltaproteobacteria bacterium RIFOXYD12_FULL_57_12]|nr:MAG: EF-P lysine aminoacylase GenX [Deltaproteobacteria bacterium RIFOXYD12_FULL_57_12]